jgi:rhodanese-related sulfurtransferase
VTGPAKASGTRGVVRSFGLVAVLGLAVLLAEAAHGPAGPMTLLAATELKTQLDAGGRPFLIDLRPADAYRLGRVPGARSIPIQELRRRRGEIPRGRLVIYCDCPREELEAAYRFLVDMGAEQIVALDGGFAGWTARGYPVER